MELRTPKCIAGKDCYSVCNAIGCNNNPYMCTNGCQCQNGHKQCFLNIKWKVLKEMLSNKLIMPSVQIQNYLNKVDQIYKAIIKQIEISYNELKNLKYRLVGLDQIQKDILMKLSQGRSNELTGKLISKVQPKYRTTQITIINDFIQEQKKEINKQTEMLVKMVSNLIRHKQLKIDSKLTKSNQIVSLFSKNIQKCSLLYRASENNFQLKKIKPFVIKLNQYTNYNLFNVFEYLNIIKEFYFIDCELFRISKLIIFKLGYFFYDALPKFYYYLINIFLDHFCCNLNITLPHLSYFKRIFIFSHSSKIY